MPLVLTTTVGLSGMKYTVWASNSQPLRRFSHVWPPSVVRISQPSSMAPITQRDSVGCRLNCLTWLMCGGCGKLHSVMVGSFCSCWHSVQVWPRSLLLYMADGEVPAHSSPVLGCCSNHHTSVRSRPLFVSRQLAPPSSLTNTPRLEVPAYIRRGSSLSMMTGQRRPPLSSRPRAFTEKPLPLPSALNRPRPVPINRVVLLMLCIIIRQTWPGRCC